MSKTDAAYMKAYRAKKKLEAEQNLDGVIGSYAGLKEQVVALTAEVKHLKAELAKRTTVPPLRIDATMPNRVGADNQPIGTFNSRPFMPAPKVKPHR